MSIAVGDTVYVVGKSAWCDPSIRELIVVEALDAHCTLKAKGGCSRETYIIGEMYKTVEEAGPAYLEELKKHLKRAKTDMKRLEKKLAAGVLPRVQKY